MSGVPLPDTIKMAVDNIIFYLGRELAAVNVKIKDTGGLPVYTAGQEKVFSIKINKFDDAAGRACAGELARAIKGSGLKTVCFLNPSYLAPSCHSVQAVDGMHVAVFCGFKHSKPDDCVVGIRIAVIDGQLLKLKKGK